MDDTEVETAIGKRPVEGPVHVGSLGLAGDERVEPRKFGEAHHAVSVLAQEHYAHFVRTLGRDFPFGAFGENLTVEGALESEIRIGDVFRCGDAVLEVAQPRIPCRKWRHQLGIASVRSLFQQRRVGFYLRVLVEGSVSAGAAFERVGGVGGAPTVDDFFRITQTDYWDAEGLASLRAAPNLVPMWTHILDEKSRRARAAEGWIGFRPMRLAARGSWPELPGTVRLVLRCAFGRPLPPFAPGQSVQCAAPTDTTDLRARRSCYVVEHPSPAEYAVAVTDARLEDDPVAAWLTRGLPVGDEVRVAAPRGRGSLAAAPPDATRHFIFHADEGDAAAAAMARAHASSSEPPRVLIHVNEHAFDFGPVAPTDFAVAFARPESLDRVAHAWSAAGGSPHRLVLERTA